MRKNTKLVDDRLYNSRTIDVYLQLLKRKYPGVNSEKILEYAQIQPYEVADQGHWFTQTQTDRFYERLVEETKNPHIAREAGRFAASPEAGWPLQFLIFGFLGCVRVYEMLGRISPRLTKSSRYETRVISPTRVEIIVTPTLGAHEKPYQCESRMGYLDAVPLMFSNSLPVIDHPECIFNGDSRCRYLVSWREPKAVRLSRFRNLLAAFSIGGLLALWPMLPASDMQTGGFLVASILLVLSLLIEREDKKEISSGMGRLRESAEKLAEQIDANYNNSLMTNEIGRALNRKMRKNDVLEGITEVLRKRLCFDRGFLMLLDDSRSTVGYSVGFGYDDAQVDFLEGFTFRVPQGQASRELLVRCLHEKEPLFIDNLTGEDLGSARSSFFFNKLGIKSMICCPVVFEEEGLGVLVVDNLNEDRPLLQSDISLLMGITPVIALSIQNAEFIDSRERQMNSILETLAATIDARDPLTAGHSIRVTEYALGICEELEMPRSFRDVVRVASLLHDYGKVGVPDSILKKEGQLTADEREIVKTHVGKTREILDRINFEGIYRQVPKIAAAHHERIDGTGYPNGLKGREIPLGAKIIAVADFFEALTSKRHYRDPEPAQDVLEMLREASGTHFDRRVVEAFVTHWHKLQARDQAAESETVLVDKVLFLQGFVNR